MSLCRLMRLSVKFKKSPFFSGTPNLITTSATIFGLALFNFVMLCQIHKRHETISPWELARIFYSYLVDSMKQIKVKVTSNV